MDGEALDRLRQKILDSDNSACFIERETLLLEHAPETAALPPGERYLHEFQLLAEHLSTPIDPDDRFAGRMAEGRWERPEAFSRIGLNSQGHITLPLAAVLRRGLAGIADDVRANAARLGTPQAAYFERQALGCIAAIRRYCERYAEAADAAGKPEMAKALRHVPYRPAYDFYSALQSIWMMQFICSTFCGARDFAPGRITRLLAPFAAECPAERQRELLPFFLVKFNEITGTCTDNFARKPVPCTSSKQYLTLGPDFSELDRAFVEAAKRVRLPQPTFNFRLRDDFDLAGEAAEALDAQCNFFNDRLLSNKLNSLGFPPEIAEDYDFTACNRVDLPGILSNMMARIDCFDNSMVWFREAVIGASSAAEVPERLSRIAYEAMKTDMHDHRNDLFTDEPVFHLESLFIGSCIRSCRDIQQGGAELFRWHHRMFSGIANMADGLTALEILNARMPYDRIVEILESDFAGEEALRQEILNRFPKFGTGLEEVDRRAADLGSRLIDAFERAARETGFIAAPSFYSLTWHPRFGAALGATPDGRKAGEPISENQSPVHGMDRNGPTALLRSVAALPLERCICGGLNLKFGTRPEAAVLRALLQTFFGMNGLHIGFTFADRATLEAARKDPASYRTLMIRKTGFSEFFIALSPEEQQEIIDRTEH